MLAPNSLEMIITRAICEFDDPVPVSTVSLYVNKLTHEVRAYTTIKTVLDRLCDKEILYRRKSGKSFLYGPLTDLDTVCINRIKYINQKLYGGEGWDTIINLCQKAKLEDAH